MKLSLKKILIESGLASYTSLGRPEGPSNKNYHHFHKYPTSSRYGQYNIKGTNKYPYIGDKDDLENDYIATKEGKNKIKKLPEMKLSEFFKFTQSANDNTSFYRPPTQGAGAMGAYGKSNSAYGTYDPSDDDNKKRMRNYNDREDSKAQPFRDEDDDSSVEAIGEVFGPNLRQRHTDRGAINMNTRDPWKSGIPGHGPKQDIEGMKDIEDFLNGDIDFDDDLIQLGETRWADTAWSIAALKKMTRSPISDLGFWEKVNLRNNYQMNSEYDFKKCEVKRAKKTKKL